MPLNPKDNIRLTAEGMIRNYGEDAADEAENLAERHAKSSAPMGKDLWLAVAQEIPSLRAKPA